MMGLWGRKYFNFITHTIEALSDIFIWFTSWAWFGWRIV